MPTYDTPEPITVALEVGVAEIQIDAGDRADTVVTVRPSDPAKRSDVTAAERTLVEYADGQLRIATPKGWRHYRMRGGVESIDVRIELPTGSQVRADAGIATVRSTGRLGETRVKAGIGAISLDRTGSLKINTGGGDIAVARAAGHAEVRTGTGAVQIGGIDGTAVVKNSNGDTWIGEVTGELRVNAANGRIAVDRAHAGVAAKTANGDIRLGEVAAGAVVAQTACGKLDVAVREGVAAWLDVDTRCGNLLNSLEAAERPAPGDAAVEIRARTAFGDITIRRAVAALQPAADPA
jgi:hypothetical protein